MRRSLLLKLSTLSSKLSPLPPLPADHHSAISWSLWIDTGGDTPASSHLSDLNYFIPSCDDGQELQLDPTSSRLIPLKSLALSPSSKLEILVQEDGAAKSLVRKEIADGLTNTDSLLFSMPPSSVAG